VSLPRRGGVDGSGEGVGVGVGSDSSTETEGFTGTVLGGALAGVLCADSLAAHGVEIYALGSSGNLLLRGAKYGVGRVKARVDVPREEQTARERLGLLDKEETKEIKKQKEEEKKVEREEEELSAGEKREIKRAYRTRAREWHPDKWQFGSVGNTTDSSSSTFTTPTNYVRGYRECQDKTRDYFAMVVDAFNALVSET
jgi:hypothetical protein